MHCVTLAMNRPFKRADIRAVAQQMEVTEYDEGEDIITAGEPADGTLSISCSALYAMVLLLCSALYAKRPYIVRVALYMQRVRDQRAAVLASPRHVLHGTGHCGGRAAARHVAPGHSLQGGSCI